MAKDYEDRDIVKTNEKSAIHQIINPMPLSHGRPSILRNKSKKSLEEAEKL